MSELLLKVKPILFIVIFTSCIISLMIMYINYLKSKDKELLLVMIGSSVVTLFVLSFLVQI